jgi:2-succinyl-5-enolpyruvyl-6-hydroxy-3-cyclohexene-1-carboxylate synthase
MESRLKNINSFWGYLLIDEFVRNGITCFCISPGSRSTSLTIAAAENPLAEKIICIDERGAAFYALGYGRASGKPAVIISTSGTAAANFYPAIVEARQSHISLIILTADRPPELRESGANQTIDQVKMFTDYVIWQFDMPCPDTNIPPEAVLTTVDQAVNRAINIPAGPVHLNCMFREPLEPTEKKFSKTYRSKVKRWEKSRLPFTSYKKTYQRPDKADLQGLIHLINETRRGLLVVGQISDTNARQSVTALASRLRWPVFADITSGIRRYNDSIAHIHHFDSWLLSKKNKKDLKPKVILHVGRPLTSKRYLRYIEQFPPQEYIYITDNDERFDPGHFITQRFSSNIEIFCNSLSNGVTGNTDKRWHYRLSGDNTKIEKLIEEYAVMNSVVTEVSLPSLVARNLGREHGLFLASSMPVRDFDIYGGLINSSSNIASNRGASGIDGTLASATGFAKGIQKPTTVVLGDLALIHDLNSLSLVNKSANIMIIIVINNHGGGIFSFLPVAGFKHVFEKYFGTPHTYNFKQVSAMFDLKYYRPLTNQDFNITYKKCMSAKKSSLIEIHTDRQENFNLHQQIQKKVKSILEK